MTFVVVWFCNRVVVDVFWVWLYQIFWPKTSILSEEPLEVR